MTLGTGLGKMDLKLLNISRSKVSSIYFKSYLHSMKPIDFGAQLEVFIFYVQCPVICIFNLDAALLAFPGRKIN